MVLTVIFLSLQTMASDGHFRKSSCSPIPTTEAEQRLAFNVPPKITWDAEIPICGLLQGKDLPRFSNLSFSILIRPIGGELSASDRLREAQELGEPRLAISAENHRRLRKEGLLFFNVDARHSSRSLPPGDYEVTIRYADLLTSEPKTMTVVPGGWPLELSRFLVRKICHEGLALDLKTHLQLQKRLETVDLSPEGATHYEEKLKLSWNQGFAKSRDDFNTEWAKNLRQRRLSQEELKAFLLVSEDAGCLRKNLARDSDLGYILRGIAQYEP